MSTKKYKGLTIKEIQAFTKIVGDNNSIHKIKQSIVPGFMMEEWLFNQGIVFHTPAYESGKIDKKKIKQELAASNIII